MLSAVLCALWLPGMTSPVCSVHFEDEYRQRHMSVKDHAGVGALGAAGGTQAAIQPDVDAIAENPSTIPTCWSSAFAERRVEASIPRSRGHDAGARGSCGVHAPVVVLVYAIRSTTTG